MAIVDYGRRENSEADVKGTGRRFIGIFAASIGALESLLSIGGTHRWWSLAIFALCVYILHGLIVFGGEESV